MRTALVLLSLVVVGVFGRGVLRAANNPTVCDPNVKQYSGYFQIDATTQKQYFYWAFSSRSNPSTDPLVLWMTGGPGCSSELALFGENGPCTLNKAGTQTINNTFSWNTNANLIYIDQPAGTGFSTSTNAGYDKNEAQVSQDMYDFLQAFFAAHPEWQKNKFFVFAESYGGHYAPAVSHRIWQGNQAGTGIKINLAGVGIGNGLTDPQVQYQYYAQMAYNYSIQKVGKPIVTLAQYSKMTKAIPTCVNYVAQCNAGDNSACETGFTYCNNAMLGPYESTGMNPYDIRKPCGSNPLCYDFSNIGTYLNTASIQSTLGVNVQWQSCNDQVNGMFANDWVHDFQTMLPDLLASNIRVMIYAGDCDFVCNWLGNKAWTLQLPWPGKNAFNAAADAPYILNGKQVGELRAAQGFSFLRVYDAGHMVPMDQPAVALKLLNDFILL